MLSLAEYLKEVSPAIIFYACTAGIHPPPSSVSVIAAAGSIASDFIV